MNESVKCTECGGNKCQKISDNKYRCLYCGTTFTSGSVVTPPEPVASQPQVIYINQAAPEPTHYQEPVMINHRKKSTALLLTFFLGFIGAEWFYLGNTVMGILCVLFCWTGIPIVISLVHFIVLLCTSEYEFNRQYNY